MLCCMVQSTRTKQNVGSRQAQNKQCYSSQLVWWFSLSIQVMSPMSADEGSVDERIQRLSKYIGEVFVGSILKDRHETLLHFHVPDDTLTWARVFGTLERAKTTYNIEDYSVSQTSLEQVFITFARAQRPLQADAADKNCNESCGACCACCLVRPAATHPHSSVSSA